MRESRGSKKLLEREFGVQAKRGVKTADLANMGTMIALYGNTEMSTCGVRRLARYL